MFSHWRGWERLLESYANLLHLWFTCLDVLPTPCLIKASAMETWKNFPIDGNLIRELSFFFVCLKFVLSCFTLNRLII